MLTKNRTASLLFILCCLLLPAVAACAPGAGIFGSGTWQASGLPHQAIRALVVNTNNPKILYAANAQGHVFVSTDAGQHWTERSVGLPLPNPLHKLAFDASGKKLYAATDKGMFVNTDTVQQWKSLAIAGSSALPADSYTAVEVDFKATNNLYVATEQHGVFASSNGGTSWTAANQGLPHTIAIQDLTFDPYQQQLWAATTAGVYCSSNRGASWQSLNNGLSAAIITYTVQPAAINGGDKSLTYLGTNHGLYLSHNSGATWARNQDNLSSLRVRQIIIDFRSANSAHIYIATDIGAFQYNASEQSWGSIASGLPRAKPVYALALGDADYTQLYAAAADTIYLFPGSNNALNLTSIFNLLLVALLFFLLYRIVLRSRKRHLKRPASNPTAETPSSKQS